MSSRESTSKCGAPQPLVTGMEALENVVYKGKSLVVTKSSESRTGYKNVILLRTDAKGPIYQAKFQVEGERGQRNCPKSYSRSAQESAAALAYFEAGYLGPMPTKKRYADHRTSQVSACPLSCLSRALTCGSTGLLALTGEGEDEGGGPARSHSAQGRSSGKAGAARERAAAFKLFESRVGGADSATVACPSDAGAGPHSGAQ